MQRKKTGDRDVDDNVAYLDDRIQRLSAVSIINGLSVIDVPMPDGADVDIIHRLGRTPIGWTLVDLVGAVSTGRIERIESTHDRAKILKLRATGWGAPIRISLWVF